MSRVSAWKGCGGPSPPQHRQGHVVVPTPQPARAVPINPAPRRLIATVGQGKPSEDQFEEGNTDRRSGDSPATTNETKSEVGLTLFGIRDDSLIAEESSAHPGSSGELHRRT